MKVAFIGLGIMGLPMANNVAKQFDLIGYDIVKKETPFPFASSYKECADFADIIISMVPKNEHFKSLVKEMKPLLKKGQIWIDMSTISPETTVMMKKELAEVGVELCDAPVVKSQPAAVKGELGIYFGGSEELFEKVKPILLCMGKNVIRMGDNGDGLKMKIIHNALVGQIQNGVNEILGLADKIGLDLHDVVTALGYGGAQCFYLDTKANNIMNHTYPTAFSVENMNKDVHFAREIADEHHAEVPSLRNVVRVYEEAMEAGLAKSDFSNTYEIVNKK
ncbi:MAG: NAD(P)-dependent oxidoreductase [Bacilli bacterium]|nr:NAD(P)-dependent oxidoreductase [Bacilli bacterium]